MTSPLPLPNPEQDWEAPAATLELGRDAVEQRIGVVRGPIARLPGGNANSTALVEGRVLKIFRREPAAASRERALIERGWRSFRVPRVLGAGPDFLLLEYVTRSPLLGSREHGAAVGRALAEIHAVRFESAGFFDEAVKVRTPFSDLVTALIRYARTEFESRPVGVGILRLLEREAPSMRLVAGAPCLVHGDFKVSNLHRAADGRVLVLDWEFAYAGSALSDIGQLLRWDPPDAFLNGFTDAYVEAGGVLRGDYRRFAKLFDLVNMAGLLKSGGAKRTRDVTGRLEATLRELA
jgi:hypothetical protein